MRRTPSSSGSALVSTLMMVVVLTIIVTAFMQSMSLERRTSGSFENRIRAELLADAGAEMAMAQLVDTDLTHLVNAYVEKQASFQGSTYTAPYLAAIKLDPTASKDEAVEILSSYATGNQTNSTDINFATPSRPMGVIGLQNVDGSRRVVPAPWIEVLRDASKPRNSDRSSPDYNPIVGRFAYWVDDESSKINLWTSGSEPSSNSNHIRKTGSDQSEIAIAELIEPSQIAAFLAQREQASLIFDPPTLETVKQLDTAPSLPTRWEDIRAFVTTFGLSDERGPQGIRKLNLNQFVETATDFTTSGGRSEIVQNVVALGRFIDAALPSFGNRAQNPGASNPAVNLNTRLLYCIKVAANIYDYIDEDSQPTVIRQDLQNWENPPNPTAIGEGAPTQPPAVFGKEIVPSITEYVGYFYNSGGSLRIDHSFEVLNIYTKPVDLQQLGTVRVLLAERNDVTPNGSGAGVAPDPDLPGEFGNPPLALTIPSSTVFAPGSYHVLTTLPSGSAFRTQWVTAGVPMTSLATSEPTYSYGSGGLRMEGDILASSADVDTEIVVANQYGYLDIQPRIAQQGPITFSSSNSRLIATQPFGNSGSGTGNNVHRRNPLDTGDPRSQSEIFPAYGEAGGSPSAIAWRRNTANSQGATNLGGDSNFGPTAAGFNPENTNTNQIPSLVAEPLIRTGPANSARPTAVIRNGPMKTIGELGFIYDPAVHDLGTYGTGNAATRQRGGFRTLAIGTRRSELDGPSALPQASYQKGTKDLSPQRAYRLVDIFESQSDTPSKILLNSSLRDPRNLALRSVFYALSTQNNTVETSDFAAPRDPLLSNSAAKIEISPIIDALVAAERAGPFFSTGQLSDLPVFNSGSSLGVSINPNDRNVDLFDRGREELVRNSIELFTLKGSVYSIYAIGQSGSEINGVFVPNSTVPLVKVVELTREYETENPIQSRQMPALLDNNKPKSSSIKTLGTLRP